MDTWRNNGLRFALALPLFMVLCSVVRAQTQNTCLDCHSALDPPLQVTEERFAQDIHSQKGLTCASCHGGDSTRADLDAMSKAAGFRGKIERKQIPELCAVAIPMPPLCASTTHRCARTSWPSTRPVCMVRAWRKVTTRSRCASTATVCMTFVRPVTRALK